MTKSREFWQWFTANHNAYTFLGSINESAKEKLLDDLLAHLHDYCDKLYFEVGRFPDREQELVITAEGDQDYFSKVEELIADAPCVNGWSFIAFKQPTNDPFKTKWEDLELDTNDIWFIPLEGANPNEIGIRVYVPNYDLIRDDDSCDPLLLKMIETIAGEKSFSVDLAYIEFEAQISDPEGV